MDRATYKLDQFLYMEWLRPEVVVWHTVAENLIGHQLRKSSDIMEIAVGNGYFTYMALGGEFKKQFDHYFSINAHLHDIYDCSPNYDISVYIEQPLQKKLALGIDHKQNSLNHVQQLNMFDQLVCMDANNEIQFDGIETVYTNSLYWLREPFTVLDQLQSKLPENGTIILVFPNEHFYSYCRSYALESPLWTMLNRHRAETMMWTSDLVSFEKEIAKLNLSIVHHQRYLSKLTLQVDDIGLRPLSPQLIKMANYLPDNLRMEVKEDWCTTCRIALKELLEHELHYGPKEGGFNFVVLKKQSAA